MLYILLFIFFLTALFAMLEDRLEEQTRNVMFLVVCFLAALAAGLRPDDVDHDYLNYVSMYYEDFNIMTEVSFLFISSLVHLLFDNYIFIFIIYAFLSLALNARALKIQTDLLFLSILVFFSTYYLMRNKIITGLNGIMLDIATLIREPSCKHIFLSRRNLRMNYPLL